MARGSVLKVNMADVPVVRSGQAPFQVRRIMFLGEGQAIFDHEADRACRPASAPLPIVPTDRTSH